ncbi:hypothetical protein M431DRAFT_508573 [Trichoderma harzianum CBS 226.95]|uniref:Uncharacterized protein n=1 Tax=Trichoderma harzianum CBS 226.95 TaxID=983964 RepID=A0A2T4ADM1_TRIHA|nr:hypothetical protein M431DRAFT_508573 [Trichoderma harzianum CBS 226.95]PTB55169.1 hypothetical protein M431DRAFT_508573 [Trichoderma harzianum CBS 226.95]
MVSPAFNYFPPPFHTLPSYCIMVLPNFPPPLPPSRQPQRHQTAKYSPCLTPKPANGRFSRSSTSASPAALLVSGIVLCRSLLICADWFDACSLLSPLMCGGAALGAAPVAVHPTSCQVLSKGASVCAAFWGRENRAKLRFPSACAFWHMTIAAILCLFYSRSRRQVFGFAG